MYRGLSKVLALTRVQSVHYHIPYLEGVLSVSNCSEGTYSLIKEMHALNCYIKILCISNSFTSNQPTLCPYPAEFGLLEFISLENPNVVLVVHKIVVYYFIFWNSFLDLWMHLSPFFCFVQELCHKIIIENLNFVTNSWFLNLTGKNPAYLCNLSFQHHFIQSMTLLPLLETCSKILLHTVTDI